MFRWFRVRDSNLSRPINKNVNLINVEILSMIKNDNFPPKPSSIVGKINGHSNFSIAGV